MADIVYMAKSAWTALLDAIRSKGGTSALMTAAQAKAAVDAIETGGGGVDPIKSIMLMNLLCPAGVTEVQIDCTKLNLTSYDRLIRNNGQNGSNHFSKVILKPSAVKIPTNRICYVDTTGQGAYMTEFVIDGTLRMYTTSSQGTFGGCTALKYIRGLLDLSTQTVASVYSGTNYANFFWNCTELIEIRFVPGSMALTTTAWVWSWQSKLSDESLVSIANALKDSYTGTITFHATPKARLASIMGTVTSDGTLSTFEIDENGTMSLQDFLTTVKGATIA